MTIWTVPAAVIRIIDGDTVKLNLDLGWHIYLVSNVRVFGINSPELSTIEGKEAKAYLEGVLLAGSLVVFESRELDKYGRPLGSIRFGNIDVGALMIERGFAVPAFYR